MSTVKTSTVPPVTGEKIGDNILKDIEKNTTSKRESIFTLVEGREKNPVTIHCVKYMKSKSEPDNKEKGSYFIHSLPASVVVGLIPAGVMHAMAEESGVRSALRQIVGSKCVIQYAPVDSTLSNGVVVDAEHEDYYVSAIKFAFSERMLNIASNLDAGIGLNIEDSGFEVDLMA